MPPETEDQELALEIPDREAVVRRVELGVRLGFFPRQRIEISDEMAAHAECVDEGLHLHLLFEQDLFVIDRVDVLAPLDRLVGHVERAEDVDIEIVFTEKQLVHLLEEQAGLGALNDAMVVGGTDGDGLGDAHLGECRRVGGSKRGGVVDRADADDEALARHEPRNRLHGAQRAGVGQRDGRAGHIVGCELVGADLADEFLVRVDETLEVERVGALDARNDERV